MGNDNRLGAALLHVIGGMMSIGFIDNFVRIMARDVGLWQFHLIRSVIILAVFAGLSALLGWRLRPRRFWPVLARSALGAGSMVLYFGAVAVIPIAEVGAGLFTAPIFVLLITVLVYGERVGPFRIGAVALGFLGVVLVLQPGAQTITVMSFIPVAAGLLYGTSMLATRRWCSGESVTTLNGWFFGLMGVYGLIGLAVLTLFPGLQGEGFFATAWRPPTALFWQILAMQVVGSMIGLALLTRGYQLADASYVSVFEYSFLLTSGFWAWVLYGDLPNLTGVIGILAIVGAGVLIIMRSDTRKA